MDKLSARQAEEAILNFMSKRGLLHYQGSGGYVSREIDSADFLSLRAECSGFLDTRVKAGERVSRGQLLAQIQDAYTGEPLQDIVSPDAATVFFVGDDAMTFQRTAVFKLVREEA